MTGRLRLLLGLLTLGAALAALLALWPAGDADPETAPPRSPEAAASTDPAPATADEDPVKANEPVITNRLSRERSPYLRQHQHNPVDWYPWGPEALQRAKDEDRPIFLSIGYAACHWCHVMEHESFEDEATAKVLNEAFVCIKVDREERPDLDRVYMNAVQIFGRGGWPMTVLLTPEGKPFWGGTYLPKDGLHRLVAEISALWAKERERIIAQAEAVTERVRLVSDGPDAPEMDGSDADLLGHMRNALMANFDARHGGYGDRPKFPPHSELLFYLDPGNADEIELAQATQTLDHMSRGGIHDHVGGGFHRYSTDAEWLLPHFEKMLYDNALLMQVYAAIHARTKAPRYKAIVKRLGAWLEREMKQAQGGYASSLDADTDGEEGTTYTWTKGELLKTLGAEDGALAARVFGFTTEGNFRDESTHAATGRNIVFLPLALDAQAKAQDMTLEALAARVDTMRETLLARRANRAQPGLDDKVITAWNGLLISGFVRAAVDCELPDYLKRAEDLADFLLKHSRREDGTLLRFPADSGPEIVGFCDDHVHLLTGLLDLAEATGKARWAKAAEALGVQLIALFHDEQGGGFWATSSEAHQALYARAKELWDSPIPSDNGAAALACLRLFTRTGDVRFEAAANDTLAAFRPLLGQPRMASMLMGLFRALALRQDRISSGQSDAVVGDVHIDQEHVTIDLFVQRDQAIPGSRVPILLRLQIADGHHAFTPGAEDGIPVTFTAADGAPAGLGTVVWPTPAAGKTHYTGQIEIRGHLEVPAGAPPGPRKIELVLTYQVCDEAGLCFPVERATLAVALRFDPKAGAARHRGLFR